MRSAEEKRASIVGRRDSSPLRMISLINRCPISGVASDGR